MGLIKENVDALVGSIYSLSNTEDDTLYESAVATVADSLPTKMLLDYAESLELDDSPTSIDKKGKKILLVLWGGAYGTNNVCSEIDYAGALRMADTESIYATNHATSESSPVYYISPNAGGLADLTTYPAPTDAQSAKVYYYTYPTSLDFASDNYIADDNSANFFPPRAYQAVYLKTAELILNTLISDAVSDEEDPELLTLYQNNLSSVQAAYAQEINILNAGNPLPGAE